MILRGNDMQARSRGLFLNGVTLIETMIYVAVFAIMIGTISVFVSDLQSSRIRSQTMLEVHDQGTTLLRAITSSIRSAESIESPSLGGSASSLLLRTSASSTDPVSYYVQDGVLYVGEASSTPVALTNRRVRVTYLTFSNVSNPSSPGSVQIRLVLAVNATSTHDIGSYSVPFYGSASIR